MSAQNQALNSWAYALGSYSYPVDLNQYIEAEDFSKHFKRFVSGDRDSTIQFEDYFRQNAPHSIEVYFEVVFWKLHSFTDQTVASNIIRGMTCAPVKLYGSSPSLLIHRQSSG